jgi:hypothetical protein
VILKLCGFLDLHQPGDVACYLVPELLRDVQPYLVEELFVLLEVGG